MEIRTTKITEVKVNVSVDLCSIFSTIKILTETNSDPLIIAFSLGNFNASSNESCKLYNLFKCVHVNKTCDLKNKSIKEIVNDDGIVVGYGSSTEDYFFFLDYSSKIYTEAEIEKI